MENQNASYDSCATSGQLITCITGGIGTSYYINQFKKPRKPREKRAIPAPTNNLEDQLNKRLGKKARNLIARLTKKYNAPMVTCQGTCVFYTFSFNFGYIKDDGYRQFTSVQTTSLNMIVPCVRSQFTLTLLVDSDTDTLMEYNFSSKASYK